MEHGTSNEVNLMMNGVAKAASIISGESNNHLIKNAEAGYNFSVSPDLLIGVGVSLLPLSNQAQRSTLLTNGISYSLPVRHPLYNYSIFVSPMMRLGEDGVIFGKIGYQSTILKENELPNFSGYIIGLGYKRFLYQSLYVFGEFNYYETSSKTINRTFNVRQNVILNANIIASPNLDTLLIGIGYQF